MSDYCYNRLYALKALIDNYVDTSGNFDFNKIIPMPKSYIGIVCSTNTYASVYKYVVNVKNDLDLWNRIVENPFYPNFYINDGSTLNIYDEDMAKRAVSNYNKYGSLTWYEWANEHWGVRGNAEETKVIASNGDEECIEFITAWNPPYGIIEALRAINPNFKWLYKMAFENDWSAA